MKSLTAVLFVGGLSTRMGQDKATLHLSGKPLWNHQLEVLRATRPQSLAVSARVRPPWLPPEVTLFLDAQPSQGPLSGLVSVLECMSTSHALVLAVDLLQMQPAYLHGLCDAAGENRGVVPERSRFLEPLCAVYPLGALPFARNALAAGELSLQRLVKSLITDGLMSRVPVTSTEEPLFTNANTPTDLLALRSSNPPRR